MPLDARTVIEKVKAAQSVIAARKDVNTSPTPAQAAASNYKLGRCQLHGIPISLENPKGSTRHGVSPNGKAWSNKMHHDYGFFTGTKAGDGDAIDVFIGPNHKSEIIFAVDQVDEDGDFDESKFLMGFDSREDAVAGYLAHYPRGWKLGTVTSCTLEQLKEWLKDGKHATSFGGQMLKAAFDANPLYDWDGTLIRRVPGNARAYMDTLKGFTAADRGPAADLAKGPLDLLTARPQMFHPAIREAATRLGLDINSITHASTKDKVDDVRAHDRPLVDDDPAILAAVRESLGANYAIDLPQEKMAKLRVRKTKMVEEHHDHCPHCDHEFHEKGYPRPNRIEGESQEEFKARYDAGDYDELCPSCKGIVDSPESTDEEIDKYQSWGMSEGMRARREKRRQRIAARAEGEKSAGLDFQKALNASDVPGDMTFFTDGADRCTIAYGDWHEEEECEKGRALAKKFFSNYEEADDTEIGRPLWAVKSISAHRNKSAEAIAPTYDFPTTGPEAIMHLLQNTSLEDLEGEARGDIASRKKTRRPRAVKILNLVEGLRRNNLAPHDMMISKVPVIQPGFRPFNVMGDTFMPGDANELYKDLIDHKDAYMKVRNTLGETSAKQEFAALQQAVRAVHGFAPSPNPKTLARGVSGFLQKITGPSGPKTSYIHRRLLSKNQDGVGRGVIIPNPDLTMDQIGIPTDAAWKMYGDYVQRNLVRSGMSPLDALKHTKDRSSMAHRALNAEFLRRPVIYSRSPAWHQYNVISGTPQLVDGDAIQISPFTTAGLGADFDGDAQFAYIQLLRRKS